MPAAAEGPAPQGIKRGFLERAKVKIGGEEAVNIKFGAPCSVAGKINTLGGIPTIVIDDKMQKRIFKDGEEMARPDGVLGGEGQENDDGGDDFDDVDFGRPDSFAALPGEPGERRGDEDEDDDADDDEGGILLERGAAKEAKKARTDNPGGVVITQEMERQLIFEQSRTTKVCATPASSRLRSVCKMTVLTLWQKML